MKDTIRQLIQQALDQLTADGTLPAGLTPDIQVENTKDRSHGDFASNIAMMLAKPAGMKPRDLAARLVEAIPAHEQLAKVEIAGPASSTSSRITSGSPPASTAHSPTNVSACARQARRSAW